MRCLSDSSLTAAMTAVGLHSLLRVSHNDLHRTHIGEGGLGVILSTVTKWVKAVSSIRSRGQGQGYGVDIYSTVGTDLFASLYAPYTSTSSNQMNSADDSALALGSNGFGQNTGGHAGQGGQGDLLGKGGPLGQDIQGSQGGQGGPEGIAPFRGSLPQLEVTLRKNYPFPVRPALFPLPPSYTQLHSQLTAIGGYSFPALCLLCGSVMDANGRGKCAAHSINCNKDASILFLLQVRYSTVQYKNCKTVTHIIYHIQLQQHCFQSFYYRTVLSFSPLALVALISPPHMWTITVKSTNTAAVNHYT